MLIEVKTKVSRIIDAKTRRRTETFIVDKEFFSEAEYLITACLTDEQNQGVVESFEIQSLRLSPIKEIATQFDGEITYLATLRDIWLADDGTEKYLNYKVLLWADNHTQAMENILQLSREGYDMELRNLRQVDYEYLTGMPETTNSEEQTDV